MALASTRFTLSWYDTFCGTSCYLMAMRRSSSWQETCYIHLASMGITELSIPTLLGYLSHLIDFFRLVVCLTWSESLGRSFCWHFILLWVKFKHDLSQLWHIWKAIFCPLLLSTSSSYEKIGRKVFFMPGKQVDYFGFFWRKDLDILGYNHCWVILLISSAFIFISFPMGENHSFLGEMPPWDHKS
jgi:hypothetical protein